MGTILTGDQYYTLTGKLLEIACQLRQGDGYPFDPERLDVSLQAVIEGRFVAVMSVASDFFTPIPDAEAPEKYKAIVAKYRVEARRLGVSDSIPVLYRVQAGFTLKLHAPQAGPCHDKFQYLQDWNFPDTPTPDSWLFVIPTLLPDSTGKSVDDQLALLRATRERLGLSNNHMMNFGGVGLVAGFQLAHLKAIGKRLPQNGLWVRTDTRDSGGRRLRLLWIGSSLYCGLWRVDDRPIDGLGVFALGVELEN